MSADVLFRTSGPRDKERKDRATEEHRIAVFDASAGPTATLSLRDAEGFEVEPALS